VPIAIFYSHFSVCSKLSLYIMQPPKLLQQQLEPLHGLTFISFVATTARNGIGA